MNRWRVEDRNDFDYVEDMSSMDEAYDPEDGEGEVSICWHTNTSDSWGWARPTKIILNTGETDKKQHRYNVELAKFLCDCMNENGITPYGEH